MAGANRETEQPNGEKPKDLKIGMRPLGLAGGMGFHPDSLAPHRDARTPNLSREQTDPLAGYKWGIFSLIGRISGGKSDSSSGDNPTPAINSETQTVHLEPRIDKLLAEASHAQQTRGEEKVARSLYTAAATGASAVYDTMIPTKKMTDADLLKRGFHAQTAVTAFINADEINDARILARTVLEDPSVPPIYKDGIQKAIEVLGETVQTNPEELDFEEI